MTPPNGMLSYVGDGSPALAEDATGQAAPHRQMGIATANSRHFMDIGHPALSVAVAAVSSLRKRPSSTVALAYSLAAR
jgi:hypothetical protein